MLRYALQCKPAGRVADGARVLGLEIWGARRATLEAQQRIRRGSGHAD